MRKFSVFTDGGARGNPGPAGIGVVILDENQKEVAKLSEYLGEMTNNQAEYRAVERALQWIKKNAKEPVEIDVALDSELLVKQLNGEYKIKNQGLKELHTNVRSLVMELGGRVTFRHVPRSENHQADRLVNEAIDKGIKK